MKAKKEDFFFLQREKIIKNSFQALISWKKNSKIIRIPKNNEITRKYINKLYKKKKN